MEINLRKGKFMDSSGKMQEVTPFHFILMGDFMVQVLLNDGDDPKAVEKVKKVHALYREVAHKIKTERPDIMIETCRVLQAISGSGGKMTIVEIEGDDKSPDNNNSFNRKGLEDGQT